MLFGLVFHIEHCTDIVCTAMCKYKPTKEHIRAPNDVPQPQSTIQNYHFPVITRADMLVRHALRIVCVFFPLRTSIVMGLLLLFLFYLANNPSTVRKICKCEKIQQITHKNRLSILCIRMTQTESQIHAACFKVHQTWNRLKHCLWYFLLKKNTEELAHTHQDTRYNYVNSQQRYYKTDCQHLRFLLRIAKFHLASIDWCRLERSKSN